MYVYWFYLDIETFTNSPEVTWSASLFIISLTVRTFLTFGASFTLSSYSGTSDLIFLDLSLAQGGGISLQDEILGQVGRLDVLPGAGLLTSCPLFLPLP